jgi:hypothetical protein
VRLNRLVFAACSILIVGVALVLSSVLAGVNSISPRTQGIGAAKAISMSDEVHTLRGGFWRVDGGFVSTIRIKNILVVAPIRVNPTLYMADGTAYPLAPVTVPVSGVATININDALAAAPQATAPHISQFGSLSLLYRYPTPGHLVAAVSVIDAPRSLSFGYMINEAMIMSADNSANVFEGLWWRHDRGVHGSISLTNTTDRRRAAIVRVTRKRGDFDLREVDLPPLTTQLLDLKEVSREAADESNAAGGVRVEFNGPTGAIMVTGSLVNESEGYSANMPFWDQRQTNSSVQKINSGSTGIMVGKPDPMMMPGFPAQTHFIPYLVLRNTTAAEMDVTLKLNYMTGTTPVNRSLPKQHLEPFESRKADLGGMLDEVGLNFFNGSINLAFTYTGRGSDLIIATGSVDNTGTYVFEVTPQAIAENIGSITGYWSVDDGNDSMFNIWNPTDAPQEILATLYYGDGSGTYKFPIHLPPQASTMIDVAMLIREKTRDIDGKVIPANIREGSASFGSAASDPTTYDGKKGITMVTSGGLFNTATATCGVICNWCNGYNNFVISPSSPFLLVGRSIQLQTLATDSFGNIHTMLNGAWSSSNNTAVTVSSGGNIAATGVGTSTISDLFSGVIVVQGNFCVGVNSDQRCPTNTVGGSTVATTAPPLATISIKFSGAKSSSLTFPASTTCSQSLGVFSCSTDWAYNLEVQAVVSDDASKWTISQTEESSRVKGTYTDSAGQHAFNTTQSIACPPCDGPLSGFFQQTSGQTNIFYIDAPTINKTLLPGESVFNATRVSNFTAHFCSTVVPTACYTQPYFIKIVVNGSILDTANSTAGLGTMSTVF